MKFDDYIQKRITIFDRKLAEYNEKIKNLSKLPIHIITKFGNFDGTAYETTPFVISKHLNPQHQEFIVAKVDGLLWDAHRPLEASSSLEFLSFEDKEGRQVFWHSSAHVLGEACESTYACHLCLGPPTDSGFFYEMSMDRTVTPEDYAKLQKAMKAATKDKQRFVRLELSKADLLDMFSENPLKLELIQTKVEEKSTVYRCGPLIDFCLGPHIPGTGYIKAIEVTHHSSSFFLGDSSRPVLQRIYGVSFPSTQLMKEHLLRLEEAKKNNHRRIGTELDLFFFSPMSPGSCFFLPKGAFIYNSLIALIKENYRKRDFKEVITPNVFTNELWKTSGHWANYKDDMFCFSADNTEMALKPMNCPGHCLLFKHLSCSYRDLPLRIADFGVLHRNEISGALTGLTRVRRFQQDDAHIFVQTSRVAEEILSALDFLKEIYAVLGFTYAVALSTRPSKYLGEASVWDQAESQLKSALDLAGVPWTLNEGDGAFYGPKIDISISDALGRQHQCGTIQLDFQLPQRFNLTFRNAEGKMEQPVMIHRAILGSVERMSGILLEHFKGRLPPWLNPNQVAIIPVTPNEIPYAHKTAQLLTGLEVFVDSSESTLAKKVLNAQKQKFSFIAVVGPKDVSAQTLAIRNLVPDQAATTIPAAAAATIIRTTVEHRDISTDKTHTYLAPTRQLPVSVSIAMQCINQFFHDIKKRTFDLLHKIKK
ncbi:threonyl-tRNA synthetase [Nematocida homosporus]|uniref:threonyl-tRNA synthetase n=1 Tax=Nematocida homosporus TaxID=1912981 RepID=UPI00221FC3C3|nr:threonyl-tRNA synthetase [Nematocida homosporus]KAI5185896.1 threonyl-tRNA synthetase [Nematocida homosporus]